MGEREVSVGLVVGVVVVAAVGEVVGAGTQVAKLSYSWPSMSTPRSASPWKTSLQARPMDSIDVSVPLEGLQTSSMPRLRRMMGGTLSTGPWSARLAMREGVERRRHARRAAIVDRHFFWRRKARRRHLSGISLYLFSGLV